jgi:Uma2 family endonuclease
VEPDIVIFDQNEFRRKKRRDGTDSEIIESAPLLVIEIVSASSEGEDELKTEMYLTIGVKEYWRIFIAAEPITVSVCVLRKGKY